MSKAAILPVLTFVGGLLASTAGATAYIHVKFATKSELKTVKEDIKDRLVRIEDKLDKALGVR